MTLQEMNEYSSTGANLVAVQDQSVTVVAGNENTTLSQVFSGTLISSYIDFSSVPDVCFVCSAVAGYYPKAATTAPNNYAGTANAEDIIKSLATKIGYTFTNNKNNPAHCVVQNQYLYGSIIDQMQQVARAATFPLVIENKTVSIWPNNGTRDDVVINVSASNGLIGYPSYWEAGFIVKTEFNPTTSIGRTINLTSELLKANGKFPIQNATHELSTLTPDGPWFTISKLSPSLYVRPN